MIFVNDLPRMTVFYTQTLGLKPVEASRLENYVEMESGQARLALHAIPADQRCAMPSPVAVRERTPIKLSFEVSDLDSECRRLEALGVPVLRRAWGGYDAVDPEGNVFGLYCP